LSGDIARGLNQSLKWCIAAKRHCLSSKSVQHNHTTISAIIKTGTVPSTRQKAFALSSTHYPSRGRTDDPYLEFRVELGKQRYMYRPGGVFSQQSMQWLAPMLVMAAGRPTCWLINKIPISFLSVVNLSKASSIAALSVLLSTTRKFFCESGGCVTCYLPISFDVCPRNGRFLTPIPARSRPVTES
jgi:hypothetical protein